MTLRTLMASPPFMNKCSSSPAPSIVETRRIERRHPGLRLRYVDLFLEAFEDDSHECAAALGRHLHWGFHEDPQTRIESAAEFSRAGEALSAHVTDAADLRDGDSILDAGCGFGGTLALLAAQDRALKLTGLNLDPRQIQRARSQEAPRNRSSIRHTRGDARELPFADKAFDAVLALELTCHLDQRAPFFAEARRVLRPGGRLVIADYAVAGPMQPIATLVDFFLGPLFTRVYGRLNCKHTIADYHKLATAHGFEVKSTRDLTRNTLPNFRFLRRLMRRFNIGFCEKRFNDLVSLAMENAARMGALKYFLLTLVRR